MFQEIKSRIANSDGRFDREVDKKIDVYAFAITMFEILALRPACKGVVREKVRTCVLAGERPEITQEISTFYPEILVNCIGQSWLQDPYERPSFETLINWISSTIGGDGFVDNSMNNTVNNTMQFFLNMGNEIEPPSTIME